MIVIGGDAGHNLGDPTSSTTVIRGAAASLADGVTDAPLRGVNSCDLDVAHQCVHQGRCKRFAALCR